MWRLSILLLFPLAAVLIADNQDEPKECAEQLDKDGLMNIIQVGQFHLDTSCPVLLDFMECFDNAGVKAIGLRMADLAKISIDPNVKRFARVFINFRDVFSDLCSEGSDLNQAYKENAECLEAMDVNPEDCEIIANVTYESYKEFEDAVQEGSGEYSRRDNRECMVQAYKSACNAVVIHNECGQPAFDLYQTIVKRSTLFSKFVCSREDLEILKTIFVDSMDLEADETDLFRRAFDLRRRRK